MSDISLECVGHFGRDMSDLRACALIHLKCTVGTWPLSVGMSVLLLNDKQQVLSHALSKTKASREISTDTS